MAKREEEIRAFKPEPYWLVEARFEASGERRYVGRYLGGRRLAATRTRPPRWSPPWRATPGEITKLEKKEEVEQPQLLYDLTSLQRHANTTFGFSARRTLSAAQRLYEEHKALTYPRTNSRFLTGDMVPEIKPTAELVGHNPQYKKAADYVLSLDSLPLQRVVNDKKVQDHHAIIPTRSEHDLGRMGQDELKVYDLVAKRFLAVFHPEAKFERTRVETTVAEHVFRTSGRRLRGGRAGRPSTATRPSRAGRGRLGRGPAPAAAGPGRDGGHPLRSSRSARRPSRRAATPTPRCSGRWRRPARRPRTPSCARP